MVDCHCHLEDEEFDADREQVVERARKAGVVMITSGLGLELAKKALQIASEFEDVHACAGLEPYSRDDPTQVIGFIRKNRKKLVGIGEVGLDYWRGKTTEQRNMQKENFRRFIQLSNELKLPIVIHSRSAGHQAIEILTNENPCRVMMHAFDGRVSHAMKGVKLGFMFSIPTSVVRSVQKQKLARLLPLENLLLETDSPVLGVDPKSRNEPCFLVESAKKIAELKSTSLDRVIEITTENANKLFRLGMT